MIFATEAIINTGIELKGDLILTATPDEEIGGISGLGYLINENLVNADFGLGIDGNFGYLCTATNGRIRWKVDTQGLAVHSSRAHTGLNAIESMSKIVLSIADYRNNVLLKRQEDIPVPPWIKMDKLTAMINVGTIQGGLAPNIVPDYCSIIVDRRTPPSEQLQNVRDEFNFIMSDLERKDPEVKLDVHEINFREGTKISMDHPWVLEVKEIYERITKTEIPTYASPGSADICYQINQGKWPSVGLGCGGLYSNGHGINENVKISELIDMTKIISSVILRKIT
jgi:succinyl-diaminopimelate desuccinylase